MKKSTYLRVILLFVFGVFCSLGVKASQEIGMAEEEGAPSRVLERLLEDPQTPSSSSAVNEAVSDEEDWVRLEDDEEMPSSRDENSGASWSEVILKGSASGGWFILKNGSWVAAHVVVRGAALYFLPSLISGAAINGIYSLEAFHRGTTWALISSGMIQGSNAINGLSYVTAFSGSGAALDLSISAFKRFTKSEEKKNQD